MAQLQTEKNNINYRQIYKKRVHTPLFKYMIIAEDHEIMQCEYLRLCEPLTLISLSTVHREIAAIRDFTNDRNISSYFLINKYVNSFPKFNKSKINYKIPRNNITSNLSQ